MTFGLKALLLVVAAILFLISTFSDTNQGDLIGWGLFLTALALVVEELPFGDMRWGAQGRRAGRR
jgi:hypothetical protein